MATVNCPSCGKPNPDTVEICQYCGTALKRASTVPLPPLHPGDMPIKKKTSDLESTLPSWLRDIRQASGDEVGPSDVKSVEPPATLESKFPSPAKPAPPRAKEAASPLDFLAGLSQANDEEEETPDWLKSIQAGMPAVPTESQKAPEPPAEEPADWLSALQPQTPVSEPPVANEPDWGFGNQPATFNFDENQQPAEQISEDTPDWLNALKSQAGDAAAQPTTFESPVPAQPAGWQTPDTETPDWLSALSDSAIGAASGLPEPESAKQQTPQADETPDWLSEMSGSGIGTASVQPEPVQPQQPTPDDDTPDWLASLSAADSGVVYTEQQPQPAKSDDTPDWLASLGGVPVEQSAVPGAPDADTPDWISSLAGSDTGAPEPFSAAASAPVDTGAPDWLSSLGESNAAPAQEAPGPNVQGDDTPDWLASLGGGNAAASQPFSAASAPADSNTPDWLSSLGGETSAVEPPSANVLPQQPKEVTPDWLSSLGSGPVSQIEPASAESSPAASAFDADLPTWLSGPGAEEPQPPVVKPVNLEQPASQVAQSAESDVPPWMADLQQSPATPTPASEDIPDWMAGLSAETPQPPSTGMTGAVPTADSELPSWLANAMGEKSAEKPVSERKPFDTGTLRELGPLEETPDWMAALGGPSPTPVETPEEKAPEVPELPAKPAPYVSASSEAPTLPPGSGEEQNLDAIFSMDMPDWLSGFTPTETEVTETKGVGQPGLDENLSPAELPSWVQAMRPVEDVMGGKISQAGDDDASVESRGPLAGMRSVLPGAPALHGIHKPKTYSIKLQVGENQQVQAALLEQILSSESTPREALKRPEVVVIRPLRWIIAGILLVTILLGALLPDIVGAPVFPAPDKSAEHARIGAFQEIIRNLSNNANVLVVADYQPGFAGEMEPVARPMLGQLMAKNARLAFISTSPVGSYMAERLVQGFAADYHYEVGAQYVNLGYLPGGAGGIQVFSELPLRTVGQDWFLGNLWEKDALKSVTKFSDFAAVIVITDNPDTGRLWIEQAEPSLSPKPMLMVTSAQAEVMLRPYVDSGQIKGMVSGLEDGALYENLLNSYGQARSYWDPFGVAVLAAELLIIVGGGWSLVAGYMARRADKMEQDEA